jgi:uncharacterized membrane protein YphA (DoxX/SURF4 family)
MKLLADAVLELNTKAQQTSMKIIYLILRILLGIVFIASAALKLFPIEAFELVLIKQVGFSWEWAPLFSRLIILFEFILGMAIAFGFKLKQSMIASVAMLLFFTVFLAYQMVIGAGDENCGCFGELIPMDAPTSIAKNLILLGWSVFLIWKLDWNYKWKYSWINLVLGAIAIPALFLALPLPSVDMNQESTIERELIQILSGTHSWDLKEDQKLIIVMMAKCVHCKQLASLLSTLDKEKAADQLRILVYGKEEDVQDFAEETGIDSFDVRKSSSRSLLQAINGTFPSAILVRNGEIISNWTGRDLNIDLLSKVLTYKKQND